MKESIILLKKYDKKNRPMIEKKILIKTMLSNCLKCKKDTENLNAKV